MRRWLPVALLGCVVASAIDAQEPAKTPDVVILHKIRTQQDQPGNLAFVNVESGEVVARVPLGREPHEVAVSSEGRYALASNTGANSNPGNTLSLVDLHTRKEIRRIDLGPMWSPHGVFYQGGLFYFTAEGARAIGAYDPETDHVVWLMGTGQNTTHNLVVSQDGRFIFTANRGSDSVSMFERTGSSRLTSNAWRSTIIPVCKSPQGLDLSPNAKELWVGCRGSNEMAVIDVAEGKVAETFPTHTAQLARVRFTLDGTRVLAADLGRGDLSFWDAATRKELGHVHLGSYCEGILMLPDGKRALAGVTTDDNVAEIDIDSMQVIKRLYTGQGPDGMAYIGER
jgi:DNA-binding beta-propeller fold protein YncE